MISILTKYWGNVGKRTLHPLRKNGHELELGLWTPREEIAFTAPPKIQSQSMSQNIHGAERCTYQNVSLMKYLAKMSLAKMSGPSCSFNDLKTMFDSTKIVLMLFLFNIVCRIILLESTKRIQTNLVLFVPGQIGPFWAVLKQECSFRNSINPLFK